MGAQREMEERYIELEEKRMKLDLEKEEKLMKMEERRRESEKEHEILLCHMMIQAVSPQGYRGGTLPPGFMSNLHVPSSSSSQFPNM